MPSLIEHNKFVVDLAVETIDSAVAFWFSPIARGTINGVRYNSLVLSFEMVGLVGGSVSSIYEASAIHVESAFVDFDNNAVFYNDMRLVTPGGGAEGVKKAPIVTGEDPIDNTRQFIAQITSSTATPGLMGLPLVAVRISTTQTGANLYDSGIINISFDWSSSSPGRPPSSGVSGGGGGGDQGPLG